MKRNLALLGIAIGLLITSEAKRQPPQKSENVNARRRREIEEMRQQEDLYPEFDAVMKKHGYEWTPHEVITQD